MLYLLAQWLDFQGPANLVRYQTFRAGATLITALVMALRISLQLSQIFLVILPLLALMVFIILRYVGPFFTSLQKATDGLNLVVQEDLNAIRVVKSFVREDREKEKFFQRSETLRQTAERAFGFAPPALWSED